jgi:hypothetical protein
MASKSVVDLALIMVALLLVLLLVLVLLASTVIAVYKASEKGREILRNSRAV